MSILHLNFVLGPTQKSSFSRIACWKMRSKKNQKIHTKVPAKSLKIVLPEKQKKILMKDWRETLLKNPMETLKKDPRKSLPMSMRKTSLLGSGAISTLHAAVVDINVNIKHDVWPPTTISSLLHHRRVT